MAESKKYYVVWEGRDTGVFDSWDECADLVIGYPNAQYKAFDNMRDAVNAFRGKPSDHLAFARALHGRLANSAQKAAQSAPSAPNPPRQAAPPYRLDALAVDGACAGNPGAMEYRCVRVADGVEVFRMGPFAGGTNNIAEYLAIVHAAAMLARRGLTSVPIYSDSATARGWVARGHSNTKVKPGDDNKEVLALLARADAWLAANAIRNPILKWETDLWGEIPADFGRK